MDRRGFLKSVAGSGAFGATPLVARAAMPGVDPRDGVAVVIVGQADVPQASVLARSIGDSLKAAGRATVQVSASAGELGSHEGVAALLERAAGARLIGVMDDASAVLFQQIAAARGATWLMETHHRVTADAVRHCCSVAGMDGGLAWGDASGRALQRISGLYLQAVGRGRMASGVATPALADSAIASWGGPASLVSFAINT